MLKTIEYKVNTSYACAIINDDYSGLEPDDITAIDLFFNKIDGDFNPADIDSLEWCSCDISGLWGDCYTFHLIKDKTKC